jgi:hypothetical protein
MPGETPRATNTIARSLAEGWHYRPDWRHLTVESYLTQQPVTLPPLEVLRDETDAFVRQLYLLRRCGSCLNPAPFRWAYECQVHNAETGAASLIRALLLARVPLREIAEKLATSRVNIFVFHQLFFDITACLGHDAWISSFVLAPIKNPGDPAELRERRLLSAALLGGERGIGQVVSPRLELTEEERKQKLAAIESALTMRAHEYVASLQAQLIPPTHADFHNLVRLMDTASRRPVADEGQASYHRMLDSMGLLFDATLKTAAQPENANNLELQEIAAVLNGSAAPKTPQKLLSW